MSDITPRNLVVLITSGPESEKASVALTIANGGLTAGLKVSIFLTASAVDIVRKGAAGHARFQPLDGLDELLADFQKRGGLLWACTPCVKSRGYEKEDLLEGTVITGASPMHELIQAGAATLSF